MSLKQFAIDVDSVAGKKKGMFNHIFMRTNFVPSAYAIALQKLFYIYHTYGVEHDAIYNPLKSVCIVSKQDSISLDFPLVRSGTTILEN